MTPAINSAGDDGQNSSTDCGYYNLSEDGADAEAPQGWDQELQDLRTDNSADSSRNQGSGRT
jgi:hypothetical protein